MPLCFGRLSTNRSALHQRCTSGAGIGRNPARGMKLLHPYGGLRVSVVYRVPGGLNNLNDLNDLNGLNGLNGLNEQHSLPTVWKLDEGLVSGDRRAKREKLETEPKIRKWFQDLTRLRI